MRRILRRTLVTLLVLALVLLLMISFGVTPGDRARIDAFAGAVRRWQSNPDFRAVQREYVVLGVDAMRARLCGLPAESIVMGFRSLPGLPDSLRVKESSAAHYRAFSAGEMSAYLHLSGEQDVPTGVRMLEELGKREPLSDAEIVKFLSDFKLPVPVATDAGAIASVRRLIADVQPARAFVIRDNVVAALTAQTIGQSIADLDAAIRANDIELWRTKQVNDLLAGVWAQSYGVIYLQSIEWFWRVQWIARVLAIAILGLCAFAAAVRIRSTTSARSADASLQSADARRSGAENEAAEPRS